MNVADSQRVASTLEKMGYSASSSPEEADVIVLNTCVVRQSAEDKAYGRLSSLKPIKDQRPDVTINLMGCLVGVKGNIELRAAFPYVDVFSPPSDPQPLIDHLLNKDGRDLEHEEISHRHALMDEDLLLPRQESGNLISAFVPVVYGCSHACTFCVIPYRRGAERSRSVGEIVREVRRLAEQGVREVTLLGQIVDRYGKDLSNGPSLTDLLRVVHDVEGINRIRFLTSHPNWFGDDLMDAVMDLPKVCEHIEVPAQAGDDQILARMKRGYTHRDYRSLIEQIRKRIPGSSIATDIIVGFPGETEGQFQKTVELLEDLQMDVAHLARYSPRPETVASRRMVDDVPDSVKLERFRILEELQEQIATKINQTLLHSELEVLVEGQQRSRWKGRTRTNKLVFFESDQEVLGDLVKVRIDHTSPWSLRGTLLS
jgi:tRNA-2-methylthio-N6-dimethylallyladenosine synthase